MLRTIKAFSMPNVRRQQFMSAFSMPRPSSLGSRQLLGSGSALLSETIAKVSYDLVDLDGRLLAPLVIEGHWLLIVVDLLVASGLASSVLVLLLVVRETQELAQGRPLLDFACFVVLASELMPRCAAHFLRAGLMARVLLRIQAERCKLSAILIVACIFVVILAASEYCGILVHFRLAFRERVSALDWEALRL